MPIRNTVIEREPLYNEVWADPVRTVAKRYGISDVGLRKICRKLGVPVPPLGYWAKIAAGKSSRVTQLPKIHRGPTTYERRVLVDGTGGEKAARIAALLAAQLNQELKAPEFRETPALHPAILRTDRSLGTRASKVTGLLESRGHNVLFVRVSPEQKIRALRIADGILGAALSSGAKLVAGKTGGDPIHMEIAGTAVEIRVEEVVTRTLRQATQEEKARQAKEYWYKPDLHVYAVSGKLKLALYGREERCPLVIASEGATPLELRLSDVLPRLWYKVAQLQVEAEMREEERERWREEYARREAREARRRQELERVKVTEGFAEQWQRAARLRVYAAALESAGKGPTAASESVNLAAELAWIRTAADWLDPLVKKHWPEVDGSEVRPEDDDDLDPNVV